MINKPIVNLVIGSEGFVGKGLVRYLESQGEAVKRFDIKRSEKEDARLAALDFTHIDRVYFLAWEVGGAKYLYRDDVQFVQLDWNLKLLLNIMPQLKASRVPFLFVSSQLAEENDTVYGVTKRLGEVWTHLLKGVRVRLWNVYGVVEMPGERSHVISDFVHQAISTGEIRMITTGEEVRQFIHIDDVCRAFHHAVANQYQGIYDVSSFEWIRILEVAKLIGTITGCRVMTGEKLGSTPITPMKGKLPGWRAAVELEDGLRRLIEETQIQRDPKAT